MSIALWICSVELDDVHANQVIDTFNDEEGEEYEASAFGGFGDYIRRKKIKLQNRDAEIRSASVGIPPIFRGVVAHVNGYTNPPVQDLHRLIVARGGVFLQYLEGKTLPTHIIASALTPKKREEFKKYRVVKPTWVVESVDAGRLLPWDNYRVIDQGRSQKKLGFENGHLHSKKSSTQSGYKTHSGAHQYNPDNNGPSRQDVPSPTMDNKQAGSEESLSDYGEFPSFTTQEAGEGTWHTSSRVKDDNFGPSMKSGEAGNEISNAVLGTEGIAGRSPPPQEREIITPKPDVDDRADKGQLPRGSGVKKDGDVNREFLQQYYSESRLHHLSTWKAELKAKLQNASSEKSSQHAGSPRLIPGTRRYILHVDFDCFFASVSILKRPELEGKAVAVAHGTGNGGSEIASCNYEARKYGIKNGMWMRGALSMCPELQIVPYDFPAYEEASEKFYSSILAIDGIVQSVSIDEALVDISNQCLEAGGSDGRGITEGSIYREQAKADEIGHALRASVKEKTGCTVSVGIGGNILLAKVALRKAKPAGQFHLKPDAALEFVGNLSVQDLPGVGYSLSAKLEELSIKFVKDLRDLSKEKLHSSLGPKTGAKMWDYARGIDRTEVSNGILRRSVSAEVNWGIRFTTQAQAEEFMRSLCDELRRRLVENLVKGKQLTLKVMRRSSDAPLEPVKHLGHGKCDVFNKSVMLGVASNSNDILGREAVSMLRSFGIAPGDLRGLGVQMTKLEPIKSSITSAVGLESSQRPLDFHQRSPVTPRKKVERKSGGDGDGDDPDNVDSPSKGNYGYGLRNVSDTVKLGPSLNDSSQKPLNLTGSQFILPSQADPSVIDELPGDIRSRLLAQSRRQTDTSRRGSVSPSPAGAASTRRRSRPRDSVPAAELPPRSQLDPEILLALPDDVRAEVLAYYDQPPPPPPPQASRQPAPRPATGSSSSKIKRPSTPTKKRRDRPPSKPAGNKTLLQTGFVRPRPSTRNNNTEDSEALNASAIEPTEICEESLAELPEDIRQEIIEEQQRIRLLRSRHAQSQGQGREPKQQQQQQQQQHLLRLSSLPERPTFTSQRLSSVPELRNAVTAWHSAFANNGPYKDDATALGDYLRRVVLEEKDMDKASSVFRWLGWLIDDGKKQGQCGVPSSQSAVSWDDAFRLIRLRIEDGVYRRGLPSIELV